MQRNAILLNRNKRASSRLDGPQRSMNGGFGSAPSTRGFGNNKKSEAIDETITETIDRLGQEDLKFQNFWVGVTNIVESYRNQHRHNNQANEDERQRFQHSVRRKAPERTYLFHPYSSFRVFWDFVLAVLLLYSIVIIPFRVGFDVEPNEKEQQLDRFVFIMFFLDIFVHANSMYLDKDTETWIYSRKTILKNYCKFWFWIDLLAAMPFDKIADIIQESSSHTSTSATATTTTDDHSGTTAGHQTVENQYLTIIRFIRAFRLIRIFKLYNFIQTLKDNSFESTFGTTSASAADATAAALASVSLSIKDKDKKEKEKKKKNGTNNGKKNDGKPKTFGGKLMEILSMNSTLLSLVRLGAQIFFIAHVFACFWHYIAIDGVLPASMGSTTWVKTFDYVDRSISSRYVASLYYVVVTMLTIGYGDIYATNSIERIYAILTMIVGGVIFGALVAQVAQAIDKGNPQQKAFNKKMYELKLFLADVGVALELRDKAKSAYAYYLQKKSSYKEAAIYDKLPSFLLQDLIYELYAKDIDKITVFRKVFTAGSATSSATRSSSIVVHFMIHSRPCQIQALDYIFREGDICHDIGFIKEGNVRITSDDVVFMRNKSSSFSTATTNTAKTAAKSNAKTTLTRSSKNQKTDTDKTKNGNEKKNQTTTLNHTEDALPGQDSAESDKILAGYLTQGDMFGDIEFYQNTTTALANYQAITYTQLLFVSHREVLEAIKNEGVTNLGGRGIMQDALHSTVPTNDSMSGRMGSLDSRGLSMRSMSQDGLGLKIESCLRQRSSNFNAVIKTRSMDQIRTLEEVVEDESIDLINRHALKKFMRSADNVSFFQGNHSNADGLEESEKNNSQTAFGALMSSFHGGSRHGNSIEMQKKSKTSDPTTSSSPSNGNAAAKPVNYRHKYSKFMKLRHFIYHNGELNDIYVSSYNVDVLAPKHVNSKTIRVLVDPPDSDDETDPDPDQPVIKAEKRIYSPDEQIVVDWYDWEIGDQYLFHPEGTFKLTWDFFIALLILYSVLIIPVELAFQQRAFAHSNTVNLFISLIFFLDIIFSFRTCIENKERDAFIISPKEIMQNYLRFWFWIDIVSTIPWDDFLQAVLVSSASSFQQLQITQIVKAIRLFRLIRVLRAVKLKMYLDKLEDLLGLSPVVFELFAMLAQVFFIIHITCCIWWGCTTIAYKGIEKDGDVPWYADAIDFGDSVSSSVAQKYLLTIYFTFTTMSTVGYGDLHPNAIITEQALGCLLVVVGASTFGYMIANVSTVLNTSSSSTPSVGSATSSELTEELNEIADYLQEKDCSLTLRRKILNYCYRQYAEVAASNDIDLVTSCLPPCLKVDILYTVNAKKINKIPIFKHIENRSVIIYLFQRLKPAFYEAEHLIIHEGDAAKELIFLVSGSARAFQVDSLFELKHGLDDDDDSETETESEHHDEDDTGDDTNQDTAKNAAAKEEKEREKTEHELYLKKKKERCIKLRLLIDPIAISDERKVSAKKKRKQKQHRFQKQQQQQNQQHGQQHGQLQQHGLRGSQTHTTMSNEKNKLYMAMAPLIEDEEEESDEEPKQLVMKQHGSSATANGVMDDFIVDSHKRSDNQQGADQFDYDLIYPSRDDEDEHDRERNNHGIETDMTTMKVDSMKPPGRGQFLMSAHQRQGYTRVPPSSSVGSDSVASDPPRQDFRPAFVKDLRVNTTTQPSTHHQAPTFKEGVRSQPTTPRSYHSSHSPRSGARSPRSPRAAAIAQSKTRSMTWSQRLTRAFSSTNTAEEDEEEEEDSESESDNSDYGEGPCPACIKFFRDCNRAIRHSFPILACRKCRCKRSSRHKSSPPATSSSVHGMSPENPKSEVHVAVNTGNGTNEDGHVEGDPDEESPQIRQRPKIKRVPNTFFELEERHFIEAGYRLLGDLAPGDFIGHIAFMSCLPHEASVRSLAPTTVYTLPKAEISTLVRTEPRVGIQLQSAIARSVIAQSTEVGRFHMRRNRAKFLKSLKRQFKHKLHEDQMLAPEVLLRSFDQIRLAKSVKTAGAGSGVPNEQTNGQHGRQTSLRRYRSTSLMESLNVVEQIKHTHDINRRTRIIQEKFSEDRIWYDSDEDKPGRHKKKKKKNVKEQMEKMMDRSGKVPARLSKWWRRWYPTMSMTSSTPTPSMVGQVSNHDHDNELVLQQPVIQERQGGGGEGKEEEEEEEGKTETDEVKEVSVQNGNKDDREVSTKANSSVLPTVTILRRTYSMSAIISPTSSLLSFFANPAYSNIDDDSEDTSESVAIMKRQLTSSATTFSSSSYVEMSTASSRAKMLIRFMRDREQASLNSDVKRRTTNKRRMTMLMSRRKEGTQGNEGNNEEKDGQESSSPDGNLSPCQSLSELQSTLSQEVMQIEDVFEQDTRGMYLTDEELIERCALPQRKRHRLLLNNNRDGHSSSNARGRGDEATMAILEYTGTRLRSQSYPSLENDLWKEQYIFQGVV